MMAPHILPRTFALLSTAAIATAADSNTTRTVWNEFTNNFATDLAPIIALFGEQVTKQFLSESTSFLDNIIFGVAPLGILTAVVSAIRVYGNASLKSFIGRAQEAHGAAEAELCSSTSEDVCELWSNGGICRVFGRPRILEFLYSPKKGEFYPTFSTATGDVASHAPSCGIDLPKTLFAPTECHENAMGSENSDFWEEVKPRLSRIPEHNRERGSQDPGHDPELGKVRQRFAPYPNLSLNIGIRTVSGLILGITAVFGVSLQLSFFVYATWTTFYNQALYDGDPPQLWSFWLAISGTAILVLGMTLCARLIERKSCERRFTRAAGDTSKNFMFWLQPGGQRVGDQLFNTFAHRVDTNKYVTSWRVDAEQSGDNPDSIGNPVVVLWIAITASLLGFVCQFVGLRGLHGSIALYQLASTLCMAVIRALLRSRRLAQGQNELKHLRRDVEGHELDWQALNIETPPGPKGTQRYDWYLDDSPVMRQGIDVQLDENVKVLGPIVETGRQIVGFCPSPGTGESGPRGIEEKCAEAAVNWMRRNEMEDGRPNEAARILHYRSRLAYLTAHPITPTGQEWDSDVRKMALQLQEALQESAQYIFSGEMVLTEDWRDTRALVWSTTCHISEPSPNSPGFPIHFLMYRDNGRWKVSKDQLEAALGLWWWSLKQLQKRPDDEQNLFTSKIMHTTDSNMMHFKSAIRLWVTQTDPVTERIQNTDSTSPNCPGPSQSLASHRSESCHPTGLSVSTAPLLPPRDPKADGTTTKSDSRALLTIETRSSPLQMIAQDIFTIFISRIADILEPLKEIVHRQTQMPTMNLFGNSPAQPYLGLTNPHVRSIADKLTASSIGPETDVLMSIVPPLLQRLKLPHLDDVMEDLLSQAKSLRRGSRFQDGEDLLKGLLHLGPFQFQERVVRSLGELYRKAIRSQKPSDQDFGLRGFENMGKTCALVSLAKPTEQTLGHYEIVGKYFKQKGKSRQTGQNSLIDKSGPNQFLENLEKQQAKPCGLTLTDEIDKIELKNNALRILKWAIKQNCPELIEDLREVDSKIINDLPIIGAIYCEVETFQSLLEWPGVRFDAPDKNGKTPLLFAAEKGCHDVVDLLLKCGADTRSTDAGGSTPLSLAGQNGHEKVVEFLVQKGKADVDMALEDGKYGSALAAAGAEGRTEIVKFLVQEGKANVDMALRSGDYGSALAAAAYEGRIETVRFLVQEGKANVNLALRSGKYGSALAAAVVRGKTESVRFLVQEGKADVNLALQSGWYGSALAAAVVRGKTETVRFLVQEGEANVNLAHQRGNYGSALAVAVVWGKTETVRFLVQEGKADVNLALQRGNYGSALAVAVVWGKTETVRFLVQEGKANVNMVLHSGDYGNALVAAAYWGRKQCVEILIGAGAGVSLNLRNGRFSTALQASRTAVKGDQDLLWDSRGKEEIGWQKGEVTALLERHGTTS